VKPAIAILLIAIGVAGIAYGGFSYWHRESVLDLGPIHASAERKTTIPIPPVAGGIAMVAGVALLLSNNRK
jgi:hypothetical protein